VKLVRFLVAHPMRTRAFAVAVLALVAAFVPGLPVNLIDAVVVAALALGAESVRTARARKAPEATEVAS
jgi:hypothetical protein